MIFNFNKNKKVKFVATSFVVVFSAIIQCFVIQSFVNSSNLLSTGFTGIAILIDKIAGIYGKTIPISFSLILLNAPVAFLCFKGLSKRFTIFSLIHVFLLSFFLKIFDFQPVFKDIILNTIFGGFLCGISVVILLEFGVSSGGTDFIASYVSNKKGISIWSYIFLGNVVLLCIFGMIFGWTYAGYSIVYQYVLTNTISAFHQRYEMVTLQITTSKSDEIINNYMQNFRHGMSCVEVLGCYSKSKMYLLHTVVSSYEVKDIISNMQEVDPYVIINVLKTERFIGRFYRPPIE